MGVTLTQWRGSIGCHHAQLSSRRSHTCDKGHKEYNTEPGDNDKDYYLNNQQTQQNRYDMTKMRKVLKQFVTCGLVVLLLAAILGPNGFNLNNKLPPSIILVSLELLSHNLVAMLFTLTHLLLMSGDVETNPGPITTCGKASCPGNGTLGTSVIHSTTDDPLTRALRGATYAMGGGISKWVNSVEEAIKEFVAREYPEDDLAKDGLTTIPDITDSRHLYSAQAKMTGLLEGDIQQVLNSPGSEDKKKILSKMSDKYRGEKGEEEVYTALKDAFDQEVAAIISSHKTGVTLLEKKLAKELAETPGTVDFKIALTLKLCQSIGVEINMTEIDEAITLDYNFGNGPYLINDIEKVIEIQEKRTDGDKHVIRRRNADMKHMTEVLKENHDLQNPKPTLDPSKNLKHYRMTLELNKQRKEHDTMIIYPKYKTAIQVEVKSIKQGMNINAPVTSAINQLKSGAEELSRIHGHVLDSEWKFRGVIALPDVTVAEKNAMCTRRKICNVCKPYILVGNMKTEIPLFIKSEFPASGGFQNFRNTDKWEMYKKLLERMAAFIYLAPALPAMETMKKITGESKEVLGGFGDNDFLPELLTCPVSHLERWKAATQSGSIPSIMFLNRQQLSVWNEKRLIFLADYSVGKTTMLKSKAMSLAVSGQSVLFIFLGTVNDWGQPAPIDAVMDIQNRQHLAGVNTVTARELQNFYGQKTWIGKFWKPNILAVLEFYLKNHPSANSQHVFIDEAPIIQNSLLLSLHMASSRIFKAKNLWKTISFILVYFLIWVITDSHWTILLPPLLFLLLIICILVGFLPSSFSPRRTAKQLNAYSTLLDTSTILWIALHTRFFRDRTVGVSNTMKKSEVEILKAALHFTFPKLRHNMRNSSEIVGKCKGLGTTNFGNSSSHFNEQVEAAESPPSSRNLSSTPSIKLELASYCKQLEDAVAYAYRKLLKVEHGQEDKCVVIIMEDSSDSVKVINGLHMAGVTNPDHLKVYLENKDTKELHHYLKTQKGVLLTTDVAFSGMEASSVLYISKTGLSINHRGSMMRAVSQMVQISGACYDSGYNILDMTFMRCSSQTWASVYIQCNSNNCNNILICVDCCQACHDWGEKQHRKEANNVKIPYPFHSHGVSLKGTIKGLFMLGFTCECNINGKCLLKKHA